LHIIESFIIAVICTFWTASFLDIGYVYASSLPHSGSCSVTVCKNLVVNGIEMSTSHRGEGDDVNVARDVGPPAAGELW